MFTQVCWDNPTNRDGLICTRRALRIQPSFENEF